MHLEDFRSGPKRKRVLIYMEPWHAEGALWALATHTHTHTLSLSLSLSLSLFLSLHSLHPWPHNRNIRGHEDSPLKSNGKAVFSPLISCLSISNASSPLRRFAHKPHVVLNNTGLDRARNRTDTNHVISVVSFGFFYKDITRIHRMCVVDGKVSKK